MIRKTSKRLLWCRVLICLNLCFIWGNSLLPGDSSSALSTWVQAILGSFLPPATGSEGGFLLRKLAHFSEFACLGFLLSWLFAMKTGRKSLVLRNALLTGFLSACADEAIQLFSPGRCSSPVDVGIDTAGAATGIALLFLGRYLYGKMKTKKQTEKHMEELS